MMLMTILVWITYTPWVPILPEPYQGSSPAGNMRGLKESSEKPKNKDTEGHSWPQQTTPLTTTTHYGYHRMPTTHVRKAKAFSFPPNSASDQATFLRRTLRTATPTKAAMTRQTSDILRELRREHYPKTSAQGQRKIHYTISNYWHTEAPRAL